MLVARMVPLLVHVLWSTLHIATAAAGEPSAACRAAMTPAEPPMLFLGGPPPARLPARHCTEADVRAGLAAGCAPDDVRELCAEPVVPAFPMGVWLQSPFRAGRYKTSTAVNMFIGLDGGLDQPQLTDLTQYDMPFVCDQNEFTLSPPAQTSKLLFGYNQMDEPDNAQEDPHNKGHYLPCVSPNVTLALYNEWKRKDPSRPVFQGLGQGVSYTTYNGRGACYNRTDMYAEYAKAADIVSFDIYPTNSDNPAVKDKLWMVSDGVTNLRRWTQDSKPVWVWIESTMIGDTGRKPTTKEVKAEIWMALVHGARGYGYFCHSFGHGPHPVFQEDAMLVDTEMAAAVKAINLEVQSLSSALLTADLVGDAADGSAVYTATSNSAVPVAAVGRKGVQSAGGVTDMYIFAVSMRNGTTEATFSLSGALSGATHVEVIGEARQIMVFNDRFSDTFTDFEVSLEEATLCIMLGIPSGSDLYGVVFFKSLGAPANAA